MVAEHKHIFPYVFLLDLAHINHINYPDKVGKYSIYDFLKKQYFLQYDLPDWQWTQWCQKYLSIFATQSLWLIDNYDAIIDTNDQINLPDYLYKVVQQVVRMPHCVIMSNKESQHMRIENYTIYQVSGFSSVNAEFFIREYFDKNDEHITRMRNFIDHIPLGSEIANNPLYLAILCGLLGNSTANSLFCHV